MTVAALPTRFSMSFLQGTTRCFRMADLSRQADTAGEDATIGTAAHETAATAGLYAKRQHVEWLSANDLEQIALRVLRNPGDDVKPLSLDGWRTVVKLARRLAFTHDEGPPPFPFGCEYEVFASRELDGQTLSSRIDWRWIDGTVCWIKDYKAGGKQAAWEPTFQGEFYAWETLETHPDLEGFWLAEHAIPYGGPKWVWMDADELTGPGSIEEYLSTQIARVEAAYADPPLLPSPGSWCNTMCPDTEGCPLPGWAKGGVTVGTEREAVDVLDRLIVQRARSAQATTALNAYLTDKELTHVVSSSGEQEFGWTDGTRCAIRKARDDG